MGHKWVFAVKRSGRFRARLVALGYSQIPGLDFIDNYAPVVQDVTFRILLTNLSSNPKFEGICIDVTTAFLYGDLDAEIYMTMPEGYKIATEQNILDDECVVLQRPIYGSVQSARQYWKKFVNKLKKEKNFEMCESDPCLLYRNDEVGLVYLCMYVDHILSVGTRESIDKAVKDIKDCFEISVDGTLKDYLGCELHFSKDKRSAWLGQPHLLKNIPKKATFDQKMISFSLMVMKILLKRSSLRIEL